MDLKSLDVMNGILTTLELSLSIESLVVLNRGLLGQKFKSHAKVTELSVSSMNGIF